MSRPIALKLRPVSHPKGDANRFCGPSAISSVTGMGSGEAARLLRAVTRKAAIQGVSHAHMFKALGRCGILPATRKEWRKADRPTLAAWLRDTHGQRGGSVFLISAGNHYQLVSGNRYVCSKSVEVVGLDDPSVARRSRVRCVWRLDAANGVTIPAEARKPKAVRKPPGERAEALRLARLHGLTLDVEAGREVAVWVYGPADVYEDEHGDPCGDPCEGEHFCTSWAEVLDKVGEYVRDLAEHGRLVALRVVA